jgi:predicted adenylyl cyclase CyaB
MKLENIEIKAIYPNLKKARDKLRELNAVFKGTDHQIDTYFNVDYGRLKLREGDIENFLIYYEREDKKTPKKSNVLLFETYPNSGLKEILQKSLGILVVVDKKRERYFIDNVKFHLDEVSNLGAFCEIEAINKDFKFVKKRLFEWCKYYMNYLEISKEDLVSISYSDLMLEKKKNV